ncbi:ABC transporter substrate-binding protein [Allokutzneria albata]|uniref:Iron complex transport system substrate-binding protein n=1 Tax=Allokutzneria albata TaxID=211114 RepID=A0A1H0AAF3_ALLAB|nr:ABC transporter substrate-binding protein [Allokutzneria albata]SDN30588.1 iron complex transport system substrate-binding protein [Allokutzneria albata]
MRSPRAPLALLALLALAACTSAPAQTPAAQGEVDQVDTRVQPLSPALDITDPRGTRITLPKAPERVVCLTGLCDDVLTELGVKPAGTSNAALLTHPALLGDAGRAVPVVPGSFGSEDVEAIAGLRPDLVIGLAGVHDQLRQAVGKFNAPLWTVDPKDWKDSVGYLRALGSLTGRVKEATDAEQRFRSKLTAAVKTSRDKGYSKKTVLLMYGSADSIGVDTTDSVVGKLLGSLYTYPWTAKGTNAETASTFSVEEILVKRPDVVFVYSLLFGTDKKLSEQLAANPVWAQVPAVKSGQVHEVAPKPWGSGRGTRSLSLIIDESQSLLAKSP